LKFSKTECFDSAAVIFEWGPAVVRSETISDSALREKVFASMNPLPQLKFITVARILRPRGNKGEVFAELLTDFSERLKDFPELLLARNSGEPRRLALTKFWIDRNHPGHAVFHFAGITSISEAETLRGLEIQIPFEERVTLPAGSYFVSDLIGCSVFENPASLSALSSPPCSLADTPKFLGTVRDVYFPGEDQPGTPLLAVESSSGEMLIPLAEDICTRIDIVARRIEVSLPEGLRDLSA
jgi:16S rRNA processing protein RimM